MILLCDFWNGLFIDFSVGCFAHIGSSFEFLFGNNNIVKLAIISWLDFPILLISAIKYIFYFQIFDLVYICSRSFLLLFLLFIHSFLFSSLQNV